MRQYAALLILILATACASGRKQLERASTYERAGMMQEAYNGYAELYDRKPRNVEAHVGMKRTAQVLFDRMQQEASALYMANDLAHGDRTRAEALNYKTRMDGKGLDLQPDPMLEMRRRDALQFEADRLYAAADAAFRADRFAEAEDLAAKSLKLLPDRKEAAYLLRIAQLEPRYREGKRAEEMGLWREAYQRYKWVTDRDATYRDTWTLLAMVREKAAYTLGYVPLYNGSIYTNEIGLVFVNGTVEAQLAASIKAAILDLQDPFLVLVDRDNTDEILAEQRRQMSGAYDDRYGAEAGRLLGARYVLTAKLLRFDDVLFKQCEVQMQLIDTETGRIHASEIVRVNKQEIGKGAPRAQLLEKAAEQIAAKVASFDPVKG
jgi:tetratricopeptide (TPR) repeat protein